MCLISASRWSWPIRTTNPFGMGGTLAKYAAQNVAIHVILATRGEAGIPGLDPDATGMHREAEARVACAVLGVDKLTFLGFLGRRPHHGAR